MKSDFRKKYLTIKNLNALIFGIVYGLGARAIFTLEVGFLPTAGLMSLSFLFLVPFVIGLITAYKFDEITSARKIVIVTMPLFAIIGVLAVSVVFGFEGIICTLMAIPVFAFMALLGGFVGVRVFYRRKDKLLISFFLLLPFLMAPLENYYGLHEKIFTEHTVITINSGEEKVWNNITRVKEISEEENSISLFQIMGFPRPISAELDTVAVGGVRKAIFDRGLFFTEIVTIAEENKVLAFSIHADPASVPPAALDEHVMVGGKYFDVLEGRYEIEKLGGNKINLHLTSSFRLTTSFNFYSGLWSKLIMRDIQRNILKIIKKRSEKQN